VYQTDMLFGFLTVREHLTYHAIARLGRSHDRAAIADRVSAVMAELGLDKCADTVIGGTDAIFLRRGISGGERKRVSIATEILRRPLVRLVKAMGPLLIRLHGSV
jgi:ABC-type multidrug transport system ATPase subunit